MSRRLQVQNLSHAVAAAELQQMFQRFGTVKSARVLDRLKTGCTTITGFVEMESELAGEAAIAGLNDTSYRGSILRVVWAEFERGRGLNLSRMFELTRASSDKQPGLPERSGSDRANQSKQVHLREGQGQ